MTDYYIRQSIVKPALTIAIPVYNRGELVKATLASVAAQTHRPLKVILVDNNSTDNTLATLSAWKQTHESDDFKIDVIREMKPGASAARNAALAVADTEWLMFFDSDDIMHPDHVEKALATASASPSASIIGWGRHIARLGKKPVIRNFTLKNPEFENLTHSILSTQSYMARTALFRRAGGWDETLSMGDDIELGARLLALRPVIAKAPGVYVDVCESPDSITHTAPDRMETIGRSLEKIRSVLPLEKHHWVDLQLLNMAATWAGNDPEARRQAERIIGRTPLPRRLLWRFLYFYQLHGGRGAARIYALLCLGRMSCK